MARSVRPATPDDTKRIENSILCGGMHADYVLGGRITLRYLQKRGDGHVFLPCEYDLRTKKVAPFHLDDWQTFSFDEKCAACHTTEFDPNTLHWKEGGVGCESCHGPGSRHGNYTSAGGMVRYARLSPVEEGMICGSCHLQGGHSTKSARRYPEGYVPGMDLFKIYRFDWSTLPTTAPTDPVDVHQKVLLKLELDGATALRCTSCHDVHGRSSEKHKTLSQQEFCFQCHRMQDGRFELRDYQVQCPVCEF